MMLWFVILSLLLVAFVCSGVEAGILSLNRVRLRNRAKHGDRAANRLQKLLKEPGRLLLAVVIVTNLATIFAITLATNFFVKYCGSYGYAIALLIFLPIYFFGLELFPKSLFRRFSPRALALLATPLRLTYLVLEPFFRLGSGLTRHILRPADANSQKLYGAREDFKYHTLESERAGAITPAERQLIHGVVDFRLVTARDLMQPLSDFPTIRPEADVEELIAASRKGSLERFLAVSESGEIVGIVSLFEAIRARSPQAKIKPHIRKIGSVTATESAYGVLGKLRAERARVVLVKENDTPKGLLFAENLYRRLVSG